MSTDSDTPKDSSNESGEEKKSIRLRLNRKNDSDAQEEDKQSGESESPLPESSSEESPPQEAPGEETQKPVRLSLKRTSQPMASEASESEAEKEEEAPPEAPEPTPQAEEPSSEEPKKPTRMQLRKKTPEEEPEEARQQAATPEVPSEELELDSPFGDDDFDDFSGPDISEPEPPEETPSEPEPESSPETPRRIQLRQKSMEAGDSSTSESPDTAGRTTPPPIETSTSSDNDEGWEGSPESQLTSAPMGTQKEAEADPPSSNEEENSPEKDPAESQSGLKLKSKGARADENKAPEGLSHGTLTPFERDKAVAESKTADENPPPLPAKEKKQKKKKKKAPPPPPKKKKPQPEDSDSSSSKAGKWIVLIGLLFVLGMIGLGTMMIFQVGPFARDTLPPDPPRVQNPDPDNQVPEEDPGPDNPLSTTRNNINQANQNNELVDTIAGESQTDPSANLSKESSGPEEEPSEPESITSSEVNENGQVIVKVNESEPGETEGEPLVSTSPTQPKPIEEEEEPEQPAQNPEIAAWVDSMSINGANESRQFIIFNNTRYEKGHFVNFTLGVQFLGVKGRNIYFRDTRGAVYLKEF